MLKHWKQNNTPLPHGWQKDVLNYLDRKERGIEMQMRELDKQLNESLAIAKELGIVRINKIKGGE